MNKTKFTTIVATVCLCLSGCAKEKKSKDRGNANEMYERICKLTKEYTEKLEAADDSTAWETTCADFEDKLDKITFSYPPDTDLLLTEGQNDTINSLLHDYVTARDRRIHGITHPIMESDTLVDTLPLTAETVVLEATSGKEDASRSRGN